jgi:geranylgeranyl pyrophosphate synthase
VARLEGFLSSWCDAEGEFAPLVRHVFAAPGKRLRGQLTLATAALHAGELDVLRGDHDALRAAAAVELIHEASLVHDDISDRSLTRRGAASVAARFGMRVAVRFGIWLAARGMALIGELETRRRLGLVFSPLTALAEGQILETVRCASPAERREHYLAVVRAKTGALMRMACDIGGRVAGLGADARGALATFADAFGVAFQVADDIRDIEAPPSLGKPGGTDLANGVWTWPVIEWLDARNAAPDLVAPDLAAVPFEMLREQLVVTGALRQARAFAAAERARAKAALRVFPDSAGRAWLHDLCDLCERAP